MTRIFQIVSFLATSCCLLFCNTITATQSDKPQDFRIEFFQEARPQNVKVFYQGKEIQHFKASGGINGIPKGTFKILDKLKGPLMFHPEKGPDFYYHPHLVFADTGRGFHAWPRLKDGTLLNFEQLGQPASHGCVRVTEKNAKWLFEHIPVGTKVIIH